MKKILIGALLASVATSAFAADLPTRKAPPVPYIAPPVFSWTGFYVGVNGGGGWGSFHGTGQVGNFPGPSGGLGGVTAGYNYQIGQWVTGLEGDFDWGDISARRTLDPLGSFTKDRLSDLATFRGRFGVAFDRALIYVTGGYAGGDVHTALFNATGPIFLSKTSWQSGYSVGGGIEYAFTNNVSAKAEYLFTSLADTSYYRTQFVSKMGLDTSLVRAGVNYKF
jgi:outer membrane immunogenic protein